MSWFSSILPRRDHVAASADVNRDANDDRYFVGMSGPMSEIDVKVTVERARKVPVIRSCLSLRSGSVGGLEHGVFRREDQDTVKKLPDHPAAIVLSNPNPWETDFEFIAQMVDDLDAHGNFYAEMVFDDRSGQLAQLWRLDPSPARMKVERIGPREKRFTATGEDGQQRVFLEDEVWHIVMPPKKNGLVGVSPILDDGVEAVAVAIALQRYANILFTNDATPPYAMSVEAAMDSDSHSNLRKAMRKWMSGRNRHTPGIFTHGMKPFRLGLTAEEAQFLDTRKELWLDLARLWRVPPHKIGILDKATYSNIEHQSLEFVTDTLRPVLELIERSVTKFLIGEPGVYFEFNVESLLRGDLKSRYEAYAQGRQWGWLSVNDILRAERRNGIGPAGDRYVEPLNMVPVGTDAQNRDPGRREAIDRSIAFLRQSVAHNGGRPRLELVKDAA